MAVIDLIPVTTPSRGMAISHVNIAIAIEFFLRRKNRDVASPKAYSLRNQP